MTDTKDLVSANSNGYGISSKNTYTRINGQTDKLPAGQYSFFMDMNGNVHYELSAYSSDKLFFEDEALPNRIMDEIKSWLDKREQYEKFGFMYKRAFMLHGPPGNGKTSLIIEISRLFAAMYDGITLRLKGNPQNLINAIKGIRETHPNRPVLVVIEEIDDVYLNWGGTLLDVLDGGFDMSGVCFVATTNFLDKLDARIRSRPSRFDTIVEVVGPSKNTRKKYLKSLGVDTEKSEEIAKASDGMSFAHLKEFVIASVILGQSVSSVRDRLQSMIDNPDSYEDDDNCVIE